jgi:hypothetical protein
MKARRRIFFILIACVATSLLLSCPSFGQLVDNTQSSNTINAGINKSFSEEVGAGHGDENTPDSSMYIIRRDPFRAMRRGRQLFQRKFTVAQGEGPRLGDGTGNINGNPSYGAGLADSCAGCHGRPRGAAGFGGDVATRPDSRDAPHLFGIGLREMLADEITQDLRAIRDQAKHRSKNEGTVTLYLSSKGINYGTITAKNGDVDPNSAIKGVDFDLRVRPFFAQGGTISIREFLVGAAHVECGMEANDPDLADAANAVRPFVTPTGMVLDGSVDKIEAPPTPVSNEMPTSIVDYLEFYLFNYFTPATYRQTPQTDLGRKQFLKIGCGDCHIPDLQINLDRRLANITTVYDPKKGIFNKLFATVTAQIIEQPGGIKLPACRPFLVKDIFTDFKRHDLGPNFWERNYDGSFKKEFLTRALWGVGSTAPYGHDGRSINLTEVILRHGAEAQLARDAFDKLPDIQRGYILEFLNSLVIFPPDDTASNLDPGKPNDPNFPQSGHGSIKLTVLFNNPGDLE